MGPYYSGRWFDVVRRVTDGVFTVVRGDRRLATFPNGGWAVAHARTLDAAMDREGVAVHHYLVYLQRLEEMEAR